MSTLFFTKILGGVAGITAVSVPSVGWFYSHSKLMDKDQLKKEIKEDPKFRDLLAERKAKEELKNDVDFLTQLEKSSWGERYEKAKEKGFTDEDGFCHLSIQQNKLTQIKTTMHTSEEQIKNLINNDEKKYACIGFSTINQMSKNGYMEASTPQ